VKITILIAFLKKGPFKKAVEKNPDKSMLAIRVFGNLNSLNLISQKTGSRFSPHFYQSQYVQTSKFQFRNN
jgi:hypothetical protein